MRLLWGAIAGLLVSGGAHATTISSTFDTGTEGWVSGYEDTPGVTTTNTVSYDAPTHSIVSYDPDSGNNAFVAPTKFGGNLSAYFGGTISFDLSDVSGNELTYSPLSLFGSSATPIYANFQGVPSTTSLTHYSITLTGANFYAGSVDGTGLKLQLTDAQLQAALANVTELAINLDWHNGSDMTYLDNVVLTSAPATAAVPEPASWGLMISGFGLIGGALRRKQRAAFAA